MKHALLALAVLPWMLVSAAPAPVLRIVRADRPVAGGADALPLVEPHVAINPTNPRHIVIAAIAAAPDRSGPWLCSTFTSFDAGATWRRHDLAVTRCIDPWVTFAPDGRVVVHAIEIHQDGEGDGRLELVQFVSTEDGRWSPPRRFGRGFEHPILSLDGFDDGTPALYRIARRAAATPDGPVHRLHLSRAAAPPWAFEEARELQPSRAALNVTGVTRLASGDLVVGYWETHERPGDDSRGMLPRARTHVLRLAGFSAAPERTAITDQCASGIEGAFPGYPSMTSPTAGPARDSIYHVCVAPGFDGVTLSVSPDGGRSWRPPVAVDDLAGAPGADSRTAMVATNDRGVVAVAWYEGRDLRDDPDRGRCQDLYLTASPDAGATFTPAVRINSVTSCPRTPENGRVAESWPMGGDYGSLAAAPDGTFVIVWADSRAGRFALRSATFAVDAH